MFGDLYQNSAVIPSSPRNSKALVLFFASSYFIDKSKVESKGLPVIPADAVCGPPKTEIYDELSKFKYPLVLGYK